MLLRLARIVGAGAIGLALADAGMAQDQENTYVKTDATSARLGGEFRAALTYTDNGYGKTGDEDPDPATTLELEEVNIILDGKINPKTNFGFRIDLDGTTPELWDDVSPIDYAYATHWLNDMFGFSIGKMRVLQGGWDFYTHDYDSHVVGAYADNLVFNKFEPMLALHGKAAGQVTVQILNDIYSGKAGNEVKASYNKKEKPTVIVGWIGEFGPISPLLNLGSFDNNKSLWVDLGIRANVAGLEGSFDYRMMNTAKKGVDNQGKAEDQKTMVNAFTLKAAYTIKGMMTPWFYFSNYSRSEPDLDKDIEYNAAPTTPAGGDPVYTFDDNGMTWGVGANLLVMGDDWSPFLAIKGQSGEWLKDPKDTNSDLETRSQLWVSLGAMAEI